MRANVFPPETYLALLADNIKRHYHNYARHGYSVAASGFDSWLDGYVPGAPHRKVSIYNEGCLLAFALDVQIRKHSVNQHSLDDVMRRLYEDFGLKNRGYIADDYKMLAEVAAGTNFDDFFADYVFGTKPYNDLLTESLAYLGLELVEKPATLYGERVFGFKADGSKVAIVAPNSPAEKAGLMIGDSLVAVNGYTNSFADWFNYFACETITLTVNSAGVLRQLVLHPSNEQYYADYSIKAIENPTAEQQEAFAAWIK
jgi:predicted metalloprotease with PDZ domain